MSNLRHVFRRAVSGLDRARGFTLVELLAVLAIIALMIAVALPAITSISGAFSLDSVSQSVSGQINLARENALASSHPVRVCFFQIADYNGSTASPVYRAMQCFQEGDPVYSTTTTLTTIALTPVTKTLYFPATVKIVPPNTVLVGGTDVSGLLSTIYTGIVASSNATYNNTTTATSAEYPILTLPPPYGVSPYIFFRIRSNGQVDQSTTGTAWSNAELTLVLETAFPATATTLPKNYVTVELNASTAAVRVFRP